MRIVDFAETLRELLEAKINKCGIEIRDSITPIQGDRLLAQITAKIQRYGYRYK
jgi:hypothetical protein